MIIIFFCAAMQACASGPAEPEESTAESMNDESGETSSTVPDDGRQELVESYPMKITKVSDGMYLTECEIEEGKLSLTFDKKSWGTFNIGAWTLSDKTRGILNFTGGGTDWEYVYRSGRAASGGWEWSGGNHGNELLVELKFYDGISGDELILETGKPAETDCVKIVEKTKLHTGDAEDTYCDVIRTYYFVGRQIRFEADYDYTKNIYHYLSYTCMFPVDKKYGLYIDFLDSDGNIAKTVETLEVGKADYSGAMYKGNASERCIVRGKTVPEYKFEIRIETVADSCDNFKNADKTFYWDMNATHNKLYFSKFNEASSTLVEAGTTYHTKSVWTFFNDQDQ